MPRRPRDEHLMRPAAPAMAAPEPHLAQEQVAMARIAQALVLHDPCHAAIAALDDDDVPLMEIASAELIGRKRVRLVTHHSTMTPLFLLCSNSGSVILGGQALNSVSVAFALQMRQFVDFFPL
jgi:hypothetical protein